MRKFSLTMLLLSACGSSNHPTSISNSQWQAGPIISGKNYSSPISVDPSGSFSFPLTAPGVHYVTRPGSLKGKSRIILRYRIEAEPNVKFMPTKAPMAPSIGPVLYFQRAGDDWSGRGKYEAYRWWATPVAPSPIVIGEHEISYTLSDKWTAVETSSSLTNPSGFADAVANSSRIGFTFGGGDGFGHGVYVNGPAKFVVESFTVE